MDTETVEEIFKIFAAVKPKPQTELNYINSYTLLVAVVLSAQTLDTSVNKVTLHLFKIVDTPAKMVALGEDKLKEQIKAIGLYNNKAKNIIVLSKVLVAEYNSEVPDSLEELCSLPGVGRKTANVVLNIAFSKPVIAVDTHVLRVSQRIGLVQSDEPLGVELELEQIIPDKWKKYAGLWLVLHGHYICKAKKPECKQCPIMKYCQFEPKTI